MTRLKSGQGWERVPSASPLGWALGLRPFHWAAPFKQVPKPQVLGMGYFQGSTLSNLLFPGKRSSSQMLEKREEETLEEISGVGGRPLSPQGCPHLVYCFGGRWPPALQLSHPSVLPGPQEICVRVSTPPTPQTAMAGTGGGTLPPTAISTSNEQPY